MIEKEEIFRRIYEQEKKHLASMRILRENKIYDEYIEYMMNRDMVDMLDKSSRGENGHITEKSDKV